MATTTVQPLPYPLPGDPADGPAQIKALAEAVEGRVVMRFPSLAARDAALPSGKLVDGMVCHVASESAVYVRAAGQWRLLWRDSGWVACSNAAGVTGLVRVRRIGDVIYLRCEATASWGANTLTTVATIPDGYRPLSTTGFAAIFQGGAAGYGQAASDGQISVRRPAAGTDYLISASTWAV